MRRLASTYWPLTGLERKLMHTLRKLADSGLLDGVTTNPSLIMKAGRPIADVIAEISALALQGACSLLFIVLFWHLATTYRWDFYIRFSNIPTPLEVLDTVMQTRRDPDPRYLIGKGKLSGVPVNRPVGLTYRLRDGKHHNRV